MLLDNEAMLCGLLDPAKPVPSGLRDGNEFELSITAAPHAMNLNDLVRTSVELIDLNADVFRPGYRAKIEAFIRKKGESGARQFSIELNRAHLRVLIAELWPPATPIGFSEICDVLKSHGLDVDRLLTMRGVRFVAWEHFQWVVRREIAAANPSAQWKGRVESEKRIFDALNERFELHVKTQVGQHRKGGKL